MGGKEKNYLFLPVFCPSWTYAVSTDGEDQRVFFLCFCPPFWINLNLSPQFLPGVLLWFNLMVFFIRLSLDFNFNNLYNYNSCGVPRKKLLYSNCTLVVLLYLSAVFPKSRVYLGEHQSKQKHRCINKFEF